MEDRAPLCVFEQLNPRSCTGNHDSSHFPEKNVRTLKSDSSMIRSASAPIPNTTMPEDALPSRPSINHDFPHVSLDRRFCPTRRESRAAPLRVSRRVEQNHKIWERCGLTQPHLVREQTVTQGESPIRLRFVPVPFEIFPKTLGRERFLFVNGTARRCPAGASLAKRHAGRHISFIKTGPSAGSRVPPGPFRRRL